MIGSPIGAPSATTHALATTPSETMPSIRACLPSATSAGLESRTPARSRTCAANSFPTNPTAPAAAKTHRCVAVLMVVRFRWPDRSGSTRRKDVVVDARVRVRVHAAAVTMHV
jgi:hypothetical protein